MEMPKEFAGIFRGADLTEDEIRTLNWITGWEHRTVENLRSAVQKAQGATLTPPNEWVSVEDALPPNMDDVLVVVQNNGECWTVTGYYSKTSKVWYAVLNGQDTQMDVLWWMPLPAPPDRCTREGGDT